MTSFEAGFIKYATEYGLSKTQATHIMKRSSDHPEVQQLFKKLPHAEHQSGEDLDVLQNMLGLNEIDKQMHVTKQNLPN